MDGYYAWMIVATALVLMMTTPALALFYGGMSRSKSVLNMMMMSYVALAVVGIVFVLWGWSMGWGADGVGNANGKLIASPFNMFALDGVSHANYIYVLFQLTFAAITAALISGSIADRVKLSSWIVFVVGWVTLAYFPIAHNVWGGGWLYTHFPNLDYAGDTGVDVHDGAARVVLREGLAAGQLVGEPAAGPHVVGDREVAGGQPQGDEHDPRHELDAVGDGSRDERDRDCGERQLEDHVDVVDV